MTGRRLTENDPFTGILYPPDPRYRSGATPFERDPTSLYVPYSQQLAEAGNPDPSPEPLRTPFAPDAVPDEIVIGRWLFQHGTNRKQMNLLGCQWPPAKGWTHPLLGTKITRDTYLKFLGLAGRKQAEKRNAEFRGTSDQCSPE